MGQHGRYFVCMCVCVCVCVCNRMCKVKDINIAKITMYEVDSICTDRVLVVT